MTEKAVCDVCGQVKDCEWCDFCKAFICENCKYSPMRLVAWLSRKGVSIDRFKQWVNSKK